MPTTTPSPHDGSAASAASAAFAAPAEPAQPVTRRVWPITAALVLLGVVLAVVDGFGAAITTAPFFGDTPSRAQYIESGVVLVSVVVPLAVLAAVGRCLGSRWGLVGLAVPAVVAALAGASFLAEDGDPTDPDAGRAVRVGDWGADLNYLNGIALVLALLLLAAVLVSRRRRAAAAAPGSSSTSA